MAKKDRLRKPTYKEKLVMAKHKLDWGTWLVELSTPTELKLVSKKSGIHRTIELD